MKKIYRKSQSLLLWLILFLVVFTKSKLYLDQDYQYYENFEFEIDAD